MTQDNGLDAQLPISKEGLLEALSLAVTQANCIRTIVARSGYVENTHPDLAITELDNHVEYLEQLHQNIKDDACSNYPPVVRKG